MQDWGELELFQPKDFVLEKTGVGSEPLRLDNLGQDY